jgi:hypothetical protein
VDEASPRPVLPALRSVFGVAFGLVLIATIQLFVLTSQTERFFAWHIAEPLTAAADGAFYLSAAIILLACARSARWLDVRPVAWAVLTISTGKLAATLLHVSTFHFSHGELTARVAAWGWLVVYALVPVALVVLIAGERRSPGPLGERRRNSGAFVAVACSASGVMIALGVAMFAFPDLLARHWPWPLTALTAQDLGAWFAGVGVLGFLTAAASDAAASATIWAGSVALAVLQGVALARYPRSVRWGSPGARLYVALFVVVGAIGVRGVRAALRAR